MAGMVPVEFWSYLNTSIKTASPDAFVMAEIYERHLYQDFIEIGRMDALYDKVDFYDTLKGIVREERHASDLIGVYDDLYPIDKNMLRFLENHDEQRIPCSEFAGDANIGLPAMTVSTLMGKGPVLHYFGQEFGEAASEDAGFGHATRTTIFDYWGFPWMKRWKSGGSYDGKDLTTEEKTLRNSYATLLRFSRDEPTMQGKFYDCHRYNLNHTENYYERVTSFCRWNEAGDPDPLLCLVNFSKWESYSFNWILPPDLVHAWQWKDGESKTLKDVFTRENMTLNVTDGKGFLSVQLKPCQSLVLKCV
jgi:hypothetical protein